MFHRPALPLLRRTVFPKRLAAALLFLAGPAPADGGGDAADDLPRWTPPAEAIGTFVSGADEARLTVEADGSAVLRFNAPGSGNKARSARTGVILATGIPMEGREALLLPLAPEEGTDADDARGQVLLLVFDPDTRLFRLFSRHSDARAARADIPGHHRSARDFRSETPPDPPEDADAARVRLAGVWPNGRSGFDANTWILSTNGFGALLLPVAELPCAWDPVRIGGSWYVVAECVDAVSRETPMTEALALRADARLAYLFPTGGTDTVAHAVSALRERGDAAFPDNDPMMRDAWVRRAPSPPAEMEARLGEVLPALLERARAARTKE